MPDWLFSTIAITAAVLLSVFVHICIPWDYVFSSAGVKFVGVDSYYYMRLADNLLANFPHLNDFDPYLIYPGGYYVTQVPTFFAYILAGSIKLLGGAMPSPATANTIAAFISPVLGALTIIPVYFIGKILINRWAGLVAALLVSVAPGSFLTITLLGSTDHHSAEVFFTTFFSLFFLLAILHGRGFTFTGLFKKQFTKESWYILFSLLAGLFFGLYLITWQGAPFFLFLIFIYFIVQAICDHMRGFLTGYLSAITFLCFGTALLVMLPFNHDRLRIASLAAVILCPAGLNAVSALLSRYKVKTYWFPVITLSLGITGGLLAWLIVPDIVETVVRYIYTFFSWRTEQNVVGEMKSLLYPGGTFTFDLAWQLLGLLLFSGIAGLIALGCQAVRKENPGNIYFAVLSLILLLATFGMIRFAAYSTIALAILSGYLAGYVISLVTIDNKTVPPKTKKHRKNVEQSASIKPARKAWLIVTAFAVIAILIPTAVNAANTAKQPNYIPSDSWQESLAWLKQNSPEPFGSADSYYGRYPAPASGTSYSYPSTMYSVAGWFDYGYWITRTAHRVPVNNPGQGFSEICQFYTAQQQSDADRQMKEWKARYVIIDNRVVSPNDKFYAVVNLINKRESDFYELCWQKKGGNYEPLIVFYPQYYRSMMIRLYNFDGQQVIPQSTPVMAYTVQKMPDGQTFKEITGLKNFNSYTEAEEFIAKQQQGNYSIIGTDPLTSPVPLEKLKGYSLDYQSTQKASIGSSIKMPEVKIFQYIPDHE